MIYVTQVKDAEGKEVTAEQTVLNEIQASAFEAAGWKLKEEPKRGKQQQ
ncbi:hypothetical protein [Paenibacillus silvisoli]|nr:hypothetical protein [Paenibacillus silvisoli]